MGQVFQFGTKYSESMGATVTSPEGEQVPVEMGSYGIGVSRLVAAIIEASHDDNGNPPTLQSIHVKVDAEGADLKVLYGAGPLLATLDTIIIECKAATATNNNKKYPTTSSSFTAPTFRVLLLLPKYHPQP